MSQLKDKPREQIPPYSTFLSIQTFGGLDEDKHTGESHLLYPAHPLKR